MNATNEVKTIWTQIMGDSLGDIDPQAYRERLADALASAYPGAEIEIEMNLNLIGHNQGPRVTRHGDDDPSIDEETVRSIEERVFGEMCADQSPATEEVIMGEDGHDCPRV